jgi:uncharacterized protein
MGREHAVVVFDVHEGGLGQAGEVGEADLLRAHGISEEIARIAECHTGAGITADECTLLRLSPRDCMPLTTEEKIVTHADNLIEGKRRVIIEESIASAIHLHRKVRRRMYHLAQDVELLCS